MKPHEMTSEEFVGLATISDCFSIDGRQDEDYEWLWDVDFTGYPVAGEAEGGYRIVHLDDWEPAGTVILVSPAEQMCGFYMDSQCWIDLEHRGKGLSTPMILAAADILGGSPVRDNEGCPVGFSEAGYRAHMAAHAFAVQEAVRNDLDVPQRVLAECHLGDASECGV